MAKHLKYMPCIAFISSTVGDKELIICEALQVLENGQQIGINCISISVDQYLTQYLTRDSIFKFIAAQWSIYTVILAYQWSRYGLKKVKP